MTDAEVCPGVEGLLVLRDLFGRELRHQIEAGLHLIHRLRVEEARCECPFQTPAPSRPHEDRRPAVGAADGSRRDIAERRYVVEADVATGLLVLMVTFSGSCVMPHRSVQTVNFPSRSPSCSPIRASCLHGPRQAGACSGRGRPPCRRYRGRGDLLRYVPHPHGIELCFRTPWSCRARRRCRLYRGKRSCRFAEQLHVGLILYFVFRAASSSARFIATIGSGFRADHLVQRRSRHR